MTECYETMREMIQQSRNARVNKSLFTNLKTCIVFFLHAVGYKVGKKECKNKQGNNFYFFVTKSKWPC